MLVKVEFEYDGNPVGIGRTIHTVETGREAFVVNPNLESEVWKHEIEAGRIHANSIVQFAEETGVDGIYWSWSFDNILKEYGNYRPLKFEYNCIMAVDGTPHSIDERFPDKEMMSCYGVADSIEQVVEYFKAAIEGPLPLAIGVYLICKKNEPADGGWRWHKWGPYIGTQEPQCEYLYDEPEIEQVIIFHAYWVMSRERMTFEQKVETYGTDRAKAELAEKRKNEEQA